MSVEPLPQTIGAWDGVVGDTFVVLGRYLDGVSLVKVGGVVADFRIMSANALSVTMPANALVPYYVEIFDVVGRGQLVGPVPIIAVVPVVEPELFRWTMSEDSSDFFISLPVSRTIDTYAVKLAQVSGSSIVVLAPIVESPSDRTTTRFRVVGTAPLSAGDKIDVWVT